MFDIKLIILVALTISLVQSCSIEEPEEPSGCGCGRSSPCGCSRPCGCGCGCRPCRCPPSCGCGCQD
ncbi:chorion class high-cysteine HCB protein 13 [Drosophila ficusphila]|uniref:chorion class high-cysteine HCB protein 13 n=1 Tax=Drosophila ficusphila TaxID=30025 RepID=UPI0007E75329|nr:chorion class high-cysteine HCB protein 13 [Drosophila ficusphila]